MNIYQNDGYLDVGGLIGTGMPFIFITGARGVGKTYGVLKYCIENNKRFILMRRTGAEMDFLSANENNNPFAALNADLGCNYGVERTSRHTCTIVEREFDENGEIVSRTPMGMVIALSTVANIRGFDASWAEVLFYDEFIPERHVRPIRDEHTAFLNAVETISRNRELKTGHTLQVICASNSNRLDNAIYYGLNLVSKVVAMQKKEQEVSVLRERGICLVNVMNSPISARKANTALYRMARGTGFEDMALSNRYIGEYDSGNIKSCPLTEYVPKVAIGELCLYRHKARPEWYATTHIQGAVNRLSTSDTDKAKFRLSYGYLWRLYLDGKLIFENRLCEIMFTRIFGV